MDRYTILHDILESALKQAGEESGMLLGQDLTITLTDSLKTNKATYFGDLEDACFVIGVDSREEYQGQFYLIFSLRDAIVMSGTLLGIPPARIQEKKRPAIIESDDFDAFSEISNMINGSFNTVFQNTLPSKVHLKVLPPKKYIPEIDKISEEEPIPDGEYLMFRSRLEITGQEMNYLDVMIPFALGNLFDPQEEEPETLAGEMSVADQAVEEAASGPAELAPSVSMATSLDEGADSIVVLEDNDETRRMIVDAVAISGYQVVEGMLDSDIKELFRGRRVRLVVISSEDADDRELAVCIKVNAMRQDADSLKESLARQNITMDTFDVTSGNGSYNGQGGNSQHAEWQELAKNRQTQQWMNAGGYKQQYAAETSSLPVYFAKVEHSTLDLRF